jgi:hypothetical protein
MSETIDPARAAAILMETISSTFADMAFIDVEPAKEGSALAEIEAPVRAAIDVLRPVSCRLEIRCPASLRARIEATLFQGQGEGRSEEDSLLEILNVAAGVFLTSYFGPGADIKLELPQYLFSSDGSEGEVLASADGDAEGEPLRAALTSIRYRY